MSMEVIRLPLPASLREKLISSGYTTLSSLYSISPSILALELKISEDEAAQILKCASTGGSSSSLASTSGNNAYLNVAQTAWDMLQTENSLAHITTTCPELDHILHGGIKCKEVTEFGGVPGIGKTQLGIQLAINVQIPVEFGGLGGKAIYIDTEGSFMVERAMQIAEACVEDLLEYSSVHRKRFPAYQFSKQPKDFLENIFYFRICSYTEQIAVVDYLEKFISEHKDVKIVIIDSISFHFRQDFEDMGRRTKLLTAMALKLMKVANRFCLAVVVLNQVTTKYSEGSFHLGLALGDTWSHSCTNRVILYWNGNERYAYVDKSPYIKQVSSPYSVTSKGIRNIESNCKRIKLM